MLPLTPAQLSPAAIAAFDAHVQQHHSRITNMKATMGRSVLVFNIYMQWYPLYEEVKKICGNRTAYLLAYTISTGSECPLCSTYFRKSIIENGERPENFAVTEKEQTLLRFAAAAAGQKGKVSNELYAALLPLYTEEQLVVLAGFIGLMIATNTFSNLFEVEIDEYLEEYK